MTDELDSQWHPTEYLALRRLDQMSIHLDMSILFTVVKNSNKSESQVFTLAKWLLPERNLDDIVSKLNESHGFKYNLHLSSFFKITMLDFLLDIPTISRRYRAVVLCRLLESRNLMNLYSRKKESSWTESWLY